MVTEGTWKAVLLKWMEVLRLGSGLGSESLQQSAVLCVVGHLRQPQ